MKLLASMAGKETVKNKEIDMRSYCKKVVTKKPHVCVYCKRLIPTGKLATAHTSFDEDGVYTCYECGACARDPLALVDCDDGEVSSDSILIYHEPTCEKCGKLYKYNSYLLNGDLMFVCRGCGNTKTIAYGW